MFKIVVLIKFYCILAYPGEFSYSTLNCMYNYFVSVSLTLLFEAKYVPHIFLIHKEYNSI